MLTIRSPAVRAAFAGGVVRVRSIKPAAEYRDYDPPLEQASRQEPFAFFAEVLSKNLPITSFIDSDFLVINERLARHYGIPGVEGPEFRRVAIGPEHHRGRWEWPVDDWPTARERSPCAAGRGYCAN
jgi:hypothetical protein